MRIVVWRPQTALQGCFGYVSPLWVWEWPTAARLRGPEWPSFMPSALLFLPGFYFLLCFLYALACDMIPKSVLCNSQAGRATHGCSCRPRPPASHGTPPLWARPDAWLTWGVDWGTNEARMTGCPLSPPVRLWRARRVHIYVFPQFMGSQKGFFVVAVFLLPRDLESFRNV